VSPRGDFNDESIARCLVDGEVAHHRPISPPTCLIDIETVDDRSSIDAHLAIERHSI
jgi:hypothetical protein